MYDQRTYTITKFGEFTEVGCDESQVGLEELLYFNMQFLLFVGWRIGHSHQLIKENKEMPTHILGHRVGTLALKVILDIVLQV